MLENDSILLRERARSCKDVKEKIRLLALHAISIGNSVSHTVEVFCVDEETVHRWIARWQEGQNLSDKSKEGRPPILDEKDKEKLRKLIDENNPQKQGFNLTMWNCKSLTIYFARKGKIVSIETIRRILKTLGGHYVKAVLRYAEADEQTRLAFAQKLVKQEKRAKGVVLFEDEMSAETTPRRGYGWTFNERLVIVAPQRGRERLNLFGAVSPYTGETIQFATGCAKTQSFVKFLKKIHEKHPRVRVCLCVDGCAIHKSSKVKRFLTRHSNIKLKLLPPYSPELNPREYWHNHLRKNLLNNKPFASATALAKAIHTFTNRTPKSEIRSVCTLNPIYNLLA